VNDLNRSSVIVGTLVQEWVGRISHGAVQARWIDEIDRDASTLMLTTQNYTQRMISGLDLARASTAQSAAELVSRILTEDLAALAEQLERVAASIREAL